MSPEPEPPAAEPRSRSRSVVWLACLCEYVLPGAGYAVLGKRGRAAVAFLGLAVMFAWGLAVDGRLDRPMGGQILALLASFASAGTGVAYFVVGGADSLNRGIGDVTSASFEYGTTFLRAAGLIGYLLVLDVYDIAVGRKP